MQLKHPIPSSGNHWQDLNLHEARETRESTFCCPKNVFDLFATNSPKNSAAVSYTFAALALKKMRRYFLVSKKMVSTTKLWEMKYITNMGPHEFFNKKPRHKALFASLAKSES